jgi:hypothetical protein
VSGTPKQVPNRTPNEPAASAAAPVGDAAQAAPAARLGRAIPAPPRAAFGAPPPAGAGAAPHPPIAMPKVPPPAGQGDLGSLELDAPFPRGPKAERATWDDVAPAFESTARDDADELAVPAPGDPLARPSRNSLFELDAPILGMRASGTAHVRPRSEDEAEPESESKKSTMEFLYEMDAPAARSTSREIDLEAEPTLAAALGEAGVRAIVTPQAAPSEAPPIDPAVADVPSLELGVLVPAPDRPQTAAAQHEQRVRRAIARIQTCRDAFRMMGFMGLADADRKSAARPFMELEAAIGRPEGAPGVIKDPDATLAGASKEQIDTVERLIGPIEDRLLLLDQMVARDAFQEGCSNRKVTRKILLRYGRLLASRRFQADERRSRFEWIATELLAPLDSAGLRNALSVDQARPVLQRLIGGLPSKAKEEELLEALAYLRDSIGRVNRFVTASEFFESGCYVDVYGYKVTTRDHLLAPEFLYFSVLLNAAVHNRVESWIRDLERLHDSNQLRQEGSPREQITRGLRAQEDAVDNALGVRRRSAQHVTRGEAPAAEAEAEAKAKATPKAKAKKKEKTRATPRIEIVWDSNLIKLLGSLVVILGVTGYLLLHTGVVGQTAVAALNGAELRKISPLLASAYIVGEGDDRHLLASVTEHRWDAIDGRRRREAADQMTAVLAASGVKDAEVKRGSAVVIRVVDGFVVDVDGGKL